MDIPKGFLDSDTFTCWVPAQAVLMKGGSADRSGKRWVQGIASTNSRDLQGEIVDQNGIDFSYFLKYGYFNNDHKPGFENKIGQPTECKVTKNGLWVKGFLFEGNKVADDVWSLLTTLEKSGATRKVGFSVQGKVQRREGNLIRKCWIQDIAITPAPVNHATWCEIAKSLSAQKWDLTKNLETTEEDEEKALTAQGNVLVPESLEGAKKEDRISKGLTFDEAVDYLIKSQDLDRNTAETIVKVTFSVYG